MSRLRRCAVGDPAPEIGVQDAFDGAGSPAGREGVHPWRGNDAGSAVKADRAWASRGPDACLALGAERFGWSRRSALPGSMTASDGTQIGWGVACGSALTPLGPPQGRNAANSGSGLERTVHMAQFVEVRIDARLRHLCVTRVLTVVDGDRLLSTHDTASGLRDTLIEAVAAALRDIVQADARFASWLTCDMGGAIAQIDVGFVDRSDEGVSEIGSGRLETLTRNGVSAAIANAIYHATGTRISTRSGSVDDRV